MPTNDANPSAFDVAKSPLRVSSSAGSAVGPGPENKGLARRNRLGHKRPPSSDALPASPSVLAPDLGRWEKPGLLFTGQPQCAAAPRPPGWRERVNSSRECVMAFIKRHRAIAEREELR